MPSPERMLTVLSPAAADILAVDADAIRRLSPQQDEFALCDHQPTAAAVANFRRAIVATAMRTKIAPRLGWTFRDQHFESGQYEWEVGGGVVVRLSKTTKETRQTAVLAAMGVQTSMFPLPEPPTDTDDVILVRLNGSVFANPTIDAASLNAAGNVEYHYNMKTIAKATVETVRPAEAPRVHVELPSKDERKRHRSNEA
jgi:hypothetical protein